MADSIKIGSLDISSFKVGSDNCKVYLGDTLLYPQSQPQTLQWVEFNSGDTIPQSLDIYGISGTPYDFNATFGSSSAMGDFIPSRNRIEISLYCNANPCYSDQPFYNDNVEIIFSNVGCCDYYNQGATVSGTIKLYIYDSPTPPTPTSYKWLATYDGGSTSSAGCDASSAITQNEISLTNLVKIEIGPCVTSIGDSAFYYCTSLTSITIGNGVTNIGNYAFYRSHAELTVLPTTPPTISTNFSRPFTKSYLRAIYVPSELVDVYKTDTNWSYYSAKIQAIPNS